MGPETMINNMRIEALVALLRDVENGTCTTLYEYRKTKGGAAIRNLKFASEHGFVKQTVDGQRKPYKLTKNGDILLDLFSGLKIKKKKK